MSDNTMYEITQQLSDKNNIIKDINDAAGLVSDMFKRRYIDKIYSAFSAAEDNAKKNPSKELNLIYAIKPFLPENSLKDYDKLVNTFVTVNAISSIRNDINTHSTVYAQSEQSLNQNDHIDSAVKADGVYEIDEDSKNKNKPVYQQNNFSADPTILIFVLLLFMNR